MFILFLGHAVGRDAFLEHGVVEPVSKLFDDKEDIARRNAHKAMEMISETPLGKRNHLHLRSHHSMCINQLMFLMNYLLFKLKLEFDTFQ